MTFLSPPADTVPALPRLTWLAWGGNPMTAQREADSLAGGAARGIAASALTLGDRLGEGASGVIHAATWRRPDAAQAVCTEN